MAQDSLATICTFLEQDMIKNMNMLYFAQNNPGSTFERIADSVVLRGVSDHPWVYISSPNKRELAVVVASLNENDRFFAVVEDWMLPMLTAGKTPLWQLSTLKLVLPQHVKVPLAASAHVSPLSVADAAYLHAHSSYQALTSPDYIRTRIQQGPSAGIYVEGKLLAWALTHDDAAIGFLHVLEAHRRKGYGYALTAYLINQLRERGQLPFVHIEEQNLKSLSLAKKLGFCEDRRVHWFEI